MESPGVIVFKTMEEVEQNSFFQNKDYTRLIQGSETYHLEISDFGTPLSNQKLISYGNRMDLTPNND